MSAQGFHLKRTVKFVAMTAAALAVAACTASYRKHGYVPTSEQLSEVVVGVDTRDSVAETIGVPTASGVLNESGYYYVSTVVRHRGAAAPKPVSRELLAVNFDSRGVVSGIQHFNLEDGQVIPLERRVTSSSIEDKTFLRQLIGNLGNFNPGNLFE